MRDIDSAAKFIGAGAATVGVAGEFFEKSLNAREPKKDGV